MSDPELKVHCYLWIECFAELKARGVPTLEQLQQIAEPDVRFRDPFNEITGIDDLVRLFRHTDSQTETLAFEVLDCAWSERTAYLKWQMRAQVRVIGDWQVTGMSEVVFSDAGRVQSHVDYWDAAADFYGRLPLIGPVLRLVGRPARIS